MAIRDFQKLADTVPENVLFNLYAARSNLEFMRRFGWDVGYMARAKRYLGRVKQITPRHKYLYQLEEAVEALDTGSDRGDLLSTVNSPIV